jgi:hypothetical protein
MTGLVTMRTMRTMRAIIKLTLVLSITHINLSCLKCLGSYPLIRSVGRGLGLESLGEKHVLMMQARHEALKCVDDLSVFYLPFQKVGFHLLGEALPDPRILLTLGVGGLHRCLVEEEPEGICKPFESSRRSGSIRTGKRKLNALYILLNNCKRVLKLGEEKADNSVFEM